MHWTKSTNYLKIQNNCNLNGEVLTEIDPLDNPLNFFEKLINFDYILQYLKLKSFPVFLDELQAFIDINFCNGMSQTTDFRSY